MFLPSWKFFDTSANYLFLELRQGESAESLGDWQGLHLLARRRPWNLFLNAETNFLLYQRTLLQQLNFEVQESFDPKDLENSLLFKTVKNWAQQSTDGSHYQFQLSMSALPEGPSQALLRSPIFSRAAD